MHAICERCHAPIFDAVRQSLTALRVGVQNKYVENMVNNPTEEKFRAINLENAAFQRLVGGKKGGLEMMTSIGFVEQAGKLVITELDVGWLKVATAELVLAAKRGPFY